MNEGLDDPSTLLRLLSSLRTEVHAEATARLEGWHGDALRPEFGVGAENLAAYLALRRRDLRPLQRALSPLGLSSLGRLEGRVIPNLEAVEAALQAICGGTACFPTATAFFAGEGLLADEAQRLFGAPPPKRTVRILVTCGAEAAEKPELMQQLVSAGADAIRINCAHDGPEIWAGIIRRLRDAEAGSSRRLPVLMDLGGPKCRTGQVAVPTHRERIDDGDRLLLVPPGAALGRGFAAECTLPEALEAARPPERVMFDDGKFGGVIESASAGTITVRIDHVPAGGRKLKSDKGINFPDTELHLSPLTGKDIGDLDFVAEHADLVGYSFVQTAGDIHRLQKELASRRPDDWQHLGLIAKIETPRAVRNLPDIMIAAAGRQPFGVMIARGDLSVELGFERVAEMQEEIIWLGEAASVPVIWATQVLESLVKKGLPSRGDMTDAAMAGRAECVMLNKGPHVVEAVEMLDRLLSRMAEHQHKKTPMLRALRSW